MLVGKWRDENSTIEYKANRIKVAKYDFGVDLEGTWSIEKGVIICVPSDPGKARTSQQKIISLTGSELVIQSLGDQQVYHARRIP